MNDRSPHDPSRGQDPGDPASERAREASRGLPRELRGVARLLDEAGARQRRRLGADAVERIFAASDLQRPFGHPDAAPVVYRIQPSASRRRPLLRLAAAVAVAAGLGAVVFVAVRARDAESTRGSARESELAVAPSAPTVAPDAPQAPSATTSKIASGFGYLDAALEGAASAPMASRSAGAVIVALADTRSGSLAGFADADDALARDLAPLFSTTALLDGGASTYDDLTEEFASVVSRASGSSSGSRSTTAPSSSSSSRSQPGALQSPSATLR